MSGPDVHSHHTISTQNHIAITNLCESQVEILRKALSKELGSISTNLVMVVSIDPMDKNQIRLQIFALFATKTNPLTDLLGKITTTAQSISPQSKIEHSITT